jgi:two-component system OmpR family sensor kinase
MRHLSVTTFIHILFSVTLSILLVTFLLFLSWDKDRRKIEEFKRYQLISLTFLSNLKLSPNKEELKKLYKELYLKPVHRKKVAELKLKIEDRGDTLFSGGSELGSVRVFLVDGMRYVYVQRMCYNLLLKDNQPKTYAFEMALGLGLFFMIVLLLLYIAILKKLSPLKELHKEIEKFAHGDMQTRITYRNEDEIGKIAKSFDEAIVHIQTLSHSKNLFMRNIMHEIRTPLTTGRIAVELIDEPQIQEILMKAFDRMHTLISELAEVERITTYGFEPTFEFVHLSECIALAKELLMVENPSLELKIQDVQLHTDSKLMALVLKNLIDNGFKYGKEKKVLVRTHGSVIEVISYGSPLEHPLSYYTEPFSQAEKRSEGFGLGLYIVDNILEKLGYRLGYRYGEKEGSNIFMLIPKSAR